MKQLNETQLQENWDKLIGVLNDTFEGERLEKLLTMYNHLQDRMIVAPASAKEEYHNCYVGGYVNHVLHVYENAKRVSELYVSGGGKKNWTDEELAFSALHHDLGKVGDLNDEYYVPQDNDWRRKNLGEVFTYNNEIQSMRVTDRALFILQHFGITCSLNETMGIKCSDGLYDESNEFYMKAYDPKKSLKNSLPLVIHWADHISTKIEFDLWKYDEEQETKKVNISVKNIKKAVETEVDTKLSGDNAKDLFDELFGDK